MEGVPRLVSVSEVRIAPGCVLNQKPDPQADLKIGK